MENIEANAPNANDALHNAETKLIWGDLSENQIQALPLGVRQMAKKERQANYRYDGIIAYRLRDGRKFIIKVFLSMLINFSLTMCHMIENLSESILPVGNSAAKVIDIGHSLTLLTDDPGDLIYVLRHMHGDESWTLALSYFRQVQVLRVAQWFQYVNYEEIKRPILRELQTTDPWYLAAEEICSIYNGLRLLDEMDAATNILGVMRSYAEWLQHKAVQNLSHTIMQNILTSPYTFIQSEMSLLRLIIRWADARITRQPNDTTHSLRTKRRNFLTKEIVERVNFIGIDGGDFRDNRQIFEELFTEREMKELEFMYSITESTRGELWMVDDFTFRPTYRPMMQSIYGQAIQIIMLRNGEDGSRSTQVSLRFHLLLRLDLADVAALKIIQKIRALVYENARSSELVRGEGYLESVIRVEAYEPKDPEEDDAMIYDFSPSALPWNAGVLGVNCALHHGQLLTSVRLCLQENARRDYFIPIGYLMHAERCIRSIDASYEINMPNEERLKFSWMEDQ